MSDRKLKPLATVEENRDPQGRNIQLCVAHELDTSEQYSVQAIVVYKGMSLCREHLEFYNVQQAFMRGHLM
jgi:hypothetical protein